MRLGIHGKQVLGVTSIVVGIVVILSLWRLADLVRVRLEESQARADLIVKAIFHRARVVIGEAGDPYQALRTDPGVRAILESALYWRPSLHRRFPLRVSRLLGRHRLQAYPVDRVLRIASTRPSRNRLGASRARS